MLSLLISAAAARKFRRSKTMCEAGEMRLMVFRRSLRGFAESGQRGPGLSRCRGSFAAKDKGASAEICR